MIDAGLPLVMCIDILGSQAENPMFGRVLKQIKGRGGGGCVAVRGDGGTPGDFR